MKSTCLDICYLVKLFYEWHQIKIPSVTRKYDYLPLNTGEILTSNLRRAATLFYISGLKSSITVKVLSSPASQNKKLTRTENPIIRSSRSSYRNIAPEQEGHNFSGNEGKV